MRYTARSAAFVALAVLSGCMISRPDRPKMVNSYLAERDDLASVRRIMILPFHAERGVTVDNDRIRDAFVNELQKLRRFEVVPLTDAAREDEALNTSLACGRLSTAGVVKLCERYSLDGVFVGAITAWRPCKLPQLGLRTNLVSMHSGSCVWAVDAIYDASDLSTISDLKHFFDRSPRDRSNLHGWEMTLLSPGKFTDFVARRCVGTWIERS